MTRIFLAFNILAVSALLYATSAHATTPNVECIRYEIWKGSDDGVTNRIFDQLEIYNQALISCSGNKMCKKLYILIPKHAEAEIYNEKEIITIPVEIYKDINNKNTIIKNYTIKCEFTKNNCASSVFDKVRKMSNFH